ncbi:MAG: hypothetical protein HOL77_15995 [Rhodobacteraceae bacterium]|nr:hypothetical protein [Paracoccaceae bacterium]
MTPAPYCGVIRKNVPQTTSRLKVTPRDANRSSEYIVLSANQHPTQITKAFASQYMQEPIYPQNDLVDLDKFNWFDPEDLHANLQDMMHVYSWDTTFSTSDAADYTAVTKWAYNSTG